MLEQAAAESVSRALLRNPRAGALPAQLYFLLQRAQQLAALKQPDLFAPVRVADYLLDKDRLFARVTLDDAEYALYEQVYSKLAIEAPKPDLVVYLQAPVDVLLERIAKRGVDYEQYIDRQYLERLNEAYARFFHEYDGGPLLIVNAATIDPISQPARLRRAAGRDQAHERAGASTTTRCAAARSSYTRGPMYTHLQRDFGRPPVTLATLAADEGGGRADRGLTCYDASFAVLLDDADVDLVLVGDSLGMVIQGHDTTVPVTMDDIVYHCAAVARGLHRPFLMADLPFMSYPSRDLALANSVRLMQEGGAQMVKLESGGEQAEIVEFLAGHDIAVCAHLGLKPQSVHKTGGFRVQGREQEPAARLIEEARHLESAGADIVLLECIPTALGQAITEALHVPVIGIGAGPDTDGQIQVLYDILDITSGRKPRFVRNFMDGAPSNLAALKRYVRAVKSDEYPAPEHSFQ